MRSQSISTSGTTPRLTRRHYNTYQSTEPTAFSTSRSSLMLTLETTGKHDTNVIVMFIVASKSHDVTRTAVDVQYR